VSDFKLHPSLLLRAGMMAGSGAHVLCAILRRAHGRDDHSKLGYEAFLHSMVPRARLQHPRRFAALTDRMKLSAH
jgi:hypothetical protein